MFLPFMDYFAKLVFWLTPGSLLMQVANIHTIFNIAIALIFLPFTGFFEKVLYFMVSEGKPDKDEIRPKHLDESMISTPAIAIGMALKEISRISDNIADMLSKCDGMFKKYDSDMIEKVLKKEDKIDKLVDATSKYLTLVMRQSISRDEFNRCMGFINILRDYEQIGDIIEKNIVYLAESKYANNIHFSEEGQKELTIMAEKVKQMTQIVNAALVTNSCYLAERAKKV